MAEVRPRWCVLHTKGWCACKRNVRYGEFNENVETLCKNFIFLPLGSGKRMPTCSECLEILEARA